MRERPDWKAYVDGSMPQAERERLHGVMSHDDALRQDYEGYCEFAETLRSRVLADPVPSFNLGRVRPPLLRRSFAFAAAGTALLAVAVVATRQGPPEVATVSGPPFSNAPVIDRFRTEDPVKASDWLGERVAHQAPKIVLSKGVSLQGAIYGKDWGGYEFTCPEGALRLRFASRDRFEPCRTVVIAGNTFYEAEGFGWRQNGLSFHLSGDKEVPLAKLVVMFHNVIAGSKWTGAVPAMSPH